MSNTEKAGILGMTSVIVIILAVVISSGGGTEANPLNPEGKAGKIQRALEEKDSASQVETAGNPALTLNKNREKTEELFGTGDRDSSKISRPADKKEKQPSKKKSSRPRYRKYTIMKGDILSRIAYRKLGTSTRWKEIKKLNPTINEKNLKPGTEILLPPR